MADENTGSAMGMFNAFVDPEAAAIVDCKDEHRFEVAESIDMRTFPGSEYGPDAPPPSATRIEQISQDQLIIQYGTIYPALLKLEQEGYISSDWGESENKRRARFYRLTRAGRRQLERECWCWEKAAAVLARFVSTGEEAV